MSYRSPDNYQDVVELVNKNGCKFIDLKFVDIPGSWQNLTLTISMLEMGLFKEGVSFDGSSIRGFQKTNDNDMILVPDTTTAFIDPICEYPTLSMICDIKDPFTRECYSRDPRNIAKKAETYLRNTGIADVSYWGPELEFFIFKSVRFATHNHDSFYHIGSGEGTWNSGDDQTDNKGYYISHKDGYFADPPRDQTHSLRSRIVEAMIQAGQDIYFHHHEVATAGQSEIGMRHGTLVRQADNILINKHITKNIASQNGFTATFMPKPLFMDNGNAMHVHQSLWRNGVNIFYDAGGYAQLSQTAKYYIGGILKHTPALLAWCAPSTNSYRRLAPGYEAPVNLVYSERNRSVAVRIPVNSSNPESKRIEYRCPDATCNPYLSFAAILMAGLDGIVNKIDPGQPVDKNIYELDFTESDKIKKVPSSLEIALNELENDHAFLLKGGVFSTDMIDMWIDYKRKNEVKQVSLRPHPYEFQLYYDV
jgi:glutamine synthetase